MRHFSIIAAFLTFLVATPAYAGNVGVTIQVGEPGFYGQIHIGGYPQPQVIYSHPIAVVPVPVSRPPIYLRVPPGYEKHWSRHCHEYNACNERVFFVRDRWYRNEYAPRYREKHRRQFDRREEHRGHDRGDRGDRRQDHGRGHGHDRGHGRD